jgi:hypothetical protein
MSPSANRSQKSNSRHWPKNRQRRNRQWTNDFEYTCRKEVILMKFQDFFLPKISRSDPEVRKKAVREEIDVELLKQVMKKDADPEVRNLARERLHTLRPELEIA